MAHRCTLFFSLRCGSWRWLSIQPAALLMLWVAAPSALAGICGTAFPSHAVHHAAGQGAPSPGEDTAVRLHGVVTGVWSDPDALHGVFIQGRDRAPDGKPSGLFVYLGDARDRAAGTAADLEAGDVVAVAGTLDRFHGRLQVRRVSTLDRCATDQDVRSAAPPPEGAWSTRYEGVRIRWTEDLTVTGNHELARHGTLHLARFGRVFRPTNFPDASAVPESRHEIILDDGRYSTYPDPVPYLNDDDTRRVGSRIRRLEGIVTHAFDAWRVHPVEPVRFRDDNPRPDPLPPPEAQQIRVAAFNVENYFLTLGERGADSEEALALQRERLLAAAESLHADILALVEVENTAEAADDFVDRLRDATGNPWERIASDADTGTDAIRVDLAYRADRVRALGRAERDARRVHHRPPLLEAFESMHGGGAFGVLAMHAKAKVGCPERGDVDRGQGCWNERRTMQAEAKGEFIDQWRRRHEGDLPVLIAGDLNAYGGEDPVRALEAGGKRDLVRTHVQPPARYTYVFRGESGYLDHLLAPDALAEVVDAVHLWPANADEPAFLDYDDGGPGGRYRRSGPWRSSDHDPLAVDLRPVPESP